jgi:hypothetical protein
MQRTLLAVVVGAIVSCAPTPVASVGSKTPAPLASYTSRAESTPTVTPEFSVSPLPSPSAIVQATGVRTNALGRLTGNWIFVGKRVPGPHNIAAEVQIWAIPLDGGTPKFALGYDVSLGGSPEAIYDNAPYLRRQFSPDGTKMVVSVHGELVVVDLPTGRSTSLGTQGFFPAWSKDGSRIAFVYYLPVGQVVPPEEAIGVVPAAGGPVTQLAKVGYSRQSVEWSPTGSMMMIAQPDRTTIIDAANGNVIRTILEIASTRSSFAHWRSMQSQVVLTTRGCDRATAKLVTMSDASEPWVTQRDFGEGCEVSIQDPRWNPVRATEILYVATRAAPGLMPSEYKAHVLDTFFGTDVVLPLNAYEATWTWDGARIAYIARGTTASYGNAVRVWRRDGTGERELLGAGETDSFFSLASLSY